jgi:iron only hydrogenase large subunit-like protein
MEKSFFYHAIKIDTEKCMGCTHCMTVCPTQAIRVLQGKAVLNPNRCIDCGECFRVCPVSAYSVTHDDLEMITRFSASIALVPGIFFGQFPDHITIDQIHQAMKKLGFTHVFEIEGGVEVLIDAFNEMVTDSSTEKPVISSFCPSVVRLIQVRFPGLTSNIAPLAAPADLAANYYRRKLIEEGFDPKQTGVFYITPCAAKIAAFKSPVGEEVSPLDGVINLNFLFNKVYHLLRQGAISNEKRETECCLPDDRSIRWSLTNGEARHINGRTLCIDGISNVIEFLEKVENEEATGVDFLELRACDESCAGGILTAENRFLSVERLNKRARKHRQMFKEDSGFIPLSFGDKKDYLSAKLKLPQKIEPRSIVLDEDMAKALHKLQKARDLMCYLPAIDCGACGAPTCQALAEDIVSQRANLSHCVFMQRQMEKHHKLSNDHAFKIIEKVWGASRLDKDCYKKGAKYETN